MRSEVQTKWKYVLMYGNVQCYLNYVDIKRVYLCTVSPSALSMDLDWPTCQMLHVVKCFVQRTCPILKYRVTLRIRLIYEICNICLRLDVFRVFLMISCLINPNADKEISKAIVCNAHLIPVQVLPVSNVNYQKESIWNPPMIRVLLSECRMCTHYKLDQKWLRDSVNMILVTD